MREGAGGMSRSIYERYEQMCHQSSVFTQSAVQGCCASSWRLHPSFGRGWMNIAHIGLGMSVGRAAYRGYVTNLT